VVRLSVNLNKVATVRNARGGATPDIVRAARAAIAAGCHGITVHPRPDERHIRRRDVYDLAAAINVELNVEGYPSPEFLDLVCAVRPTQCTLVPDPPDVLTSNAGWAFDTDLDWLRPVLERLRAHGVRTSLFAEPVPAHMPRARVLGADRIELYTESYARTFGTPDGPAVFAQYRATAVAAVEAGLGVNAGHDLDLRNLPQMARNLPGLLEVSIGHALVSDALFMGFDAAVRAYLTALG
jgi:pyridoxine 5-phosphate synthase